MTLLLIALLAASMISLTIGQFPLRLGALVDILIAGPQATAADPAVRVVWDLRLPRIAAALCFGLALATTGVAYQSLFRNPLVSPDILGVSAGSALGAVAGIFWSLPIWGIYALAFGSGLAVVALVWILASRFRSTDTLLHMVLIGIVVGALAGAATSLLKVMADPYDQLPAMTFWLLGSLSGIARQEIGLGIALIATCSAVLFALRHRLNALVLPEDEARAMGIHLSAIRAIVIICATLMTACVVSMAGVIGWIGLIVPHIARLVVGAALPALLPVTACIGAILLLVIDTAARSLTATEIPLGVLTAVVGAPVFLAVLIRARWSHR
jgi:iron complex transport system permease protein